jgi:hypothetical protein
MATQISAAASLRSADNSAAAWALFQAFNYLICQILWSTGRVIFGVASNFSLL